MSIAIQAWNEVGSADVQKAGGRNGEEVRHDARGLADAQVGQSGACDGGRGRQGVQQKRLPPAITAVQQHAEIPQFLWQFMRHHRQRRGNAQWRRFEKGGGYDHAVYEIVERVPDQDDGAGSSVHSAIGAVTVAPDQVLLQQKEHQNARQGYR